MEKDYPNASDEGRETADGPRRDDTNRTNPDPLAKFAKDKRKRITRVEKNPGRFDERPAAARPPREERSYPDSKTERPPRSYGDGERRSYNPNFTPDNKLRGSGSPYRRDDRGVVDTSKDDYFNSDKYTPGGPQRRSGDDRGNRGGGNRPGGYGQKPSYGNRNSGYDNRGGYNSDSRGGYNRDGRQGSGEANRGGKPSAHGGYGQANRGTGYGGNRPPGGKPGGYGNSQGGRPESYGDNRRPDNRYGDRNKQSGFAPRSGAGPRKGGFDPRRSKPAFDKENYPKYPRGRQQEDIRLNRFLSMSGICSRREADELIAAGRVTVNETVVTEMGSKVMPDDVVRYDGTIVRGESKVYVVMNKPKGYVTSLDDPHAEKTVMDILKDSVKERIYPVGRLDKNSMGVLLITNDGDMTKKLTHPSYEKKKIYQVSLDRALSPEDMKSIADGVTLEDGFIRADGIDYVNDDPKEIGIEIHSGRNRVVRRIFEHLGYQVRKLDRVYFAGLTKKNLKRGAWRFLTPREVSALHSGQYE